LFILLLIFYLHRLDLKCDSSVGPVTTLSLGTEKLGFDFRQKKELRSVQTGLRFHPASIATDFGKFRLYGKGGQSVRLVSRLRIHEATLTLLHMPL
jgi:hypothetical protein